MNEDLRVKNLKSKREGRIRAISHSAFITDCLHYRLPSQPFLSDRQTLKINGMKRTLKDTKSTLKWSKSGPVILFPPLQVRLKRSLLFFGRFFQSSIYASSADGLTTTTWERIPVWFSFFLSSCLSLFLQPIFISFSEPFIHVCIVKWSMNNCPSTQKQLKYYYSFFSFTKRTTSSANFMSRCFSSSLWVWASVLSCPPILFYCLEKAFLSNNPWFPPN